MYDPVHVVDGHWLVNGSSFPRGRVRHETGNGACGGGRKREICKSPRVADSFGQKPGWFDNPMGDDARLRYVSRPEGIGTTGPNALHAGDNIKVKFIPARNGSPAGFSKDRNHAAWTRDPDLRR